MPNNFLVESNDTENGYIYQDLHANLMRLQKEAEDIQNVMNAFNELGFSPAQIVELSDQIDKRAKLEYVQNHIQNSSIHVDSVKAMEWDNKYDRPLTGIPETELHSDVRRKLDTIANGGTGSLLKYKTYVGNGYARTFSYKHNLNTIDITVTIWDTIVNQQVMTDVTIIDANTVKIDFAESPQINQYKLIVIG